MIDSPKLLEYRSRIEATFERWLPPADTHPERLHQAMRYAALNGGKQVRPLLVYASGKALGVPVETLDDPACAVEFVHVFSLVHDDLPAMDDDDLRRGKPTCHKMFDDATAILAGDALQSLAFYILSRSDRMEVSAQRRLEMLETLSFASGSRGMAGGQAIDIASEGKRLDLAELENMHIHKTGTLIRASVRLGALSSPEADPEQIRLLDRYAKCIGLSYQIQDDILDVEGDTSTLGKTQGSDLARGKPTYPALMGIEGARRRARELYEESLESLTAFDQRADLLRQLSRYIVERSS